MVTYCWVLLVLLLFVDDDDDVDGALLFLRAVLFFARGGSDSGKSKFIEIQFIFVTDQTLAQ